MDVPDMPADDEDGQRGTLAASARGWHRIQLGALGFIGLCGALWSVGESSAPQWASWLAAAITLAAIVLQGVAIYVVGTVAYPFYGVPDRTDTATVAAGSQRLRTGIRMTYVAVGLVVVATLAAWWPQADSGGSGGSGLVEARDASGTSVCGELLGGSGGELELETADGRVTVPLDAVAELRPVTDC